MMPIRFNENRRRDTDETFSFNLLKVCNSSNVGRSSSDLDAQFLHSLLIIDVLLRMKTVSSNSNHELIDLCKKEYESSQRELTNINEFALKYTRDRALWWYTKDSFLYKMLNKAFRTGNVYLLYLFCSFIRDLRDELVKYQCKSRTFVYRGQLITDDELSHFQNSIGHYISINSFFSTSLDRRLALFYLGNSTGSNTIFQRVLFEIEADPDIDEIKPFANIAHHSAFPSEEEVLFMARSSFQLVDCVFHENEDIHIVHMRLCSDQESDLKNIFDTNRKHYGGGEQCETNVMTLGNVLQRMGKLDDAEMFYRRQFIELDLINDDRLSSAYYFNIGEILCEKGNYEASMENYLKSLEIDMKTLPSTHPNIGNTHNSIGIIHERRCNYESALDSYSLAVKITLRALGPDDTRLALCLNNLGNAYLGLENYIDALQCQRLALSIRQKNLPSNHHRLGASHNNIAIIYHYLDNFDLALEHYKQAIEIHRKSLPPHHKYTGIVARNISLLYERQGHIQTALNHLEQEVKRRRQVLQSDHADIAEVEADIERLKDKLLCKIIGKRVGSLS